MTAIEQLAEALSKIALLRVQVRQADERGDEAMRRAHAAEEEVERLRADVATYMQIANEQASELADLQTTQRATIHAVVGNLRRGLQAARDTFLAYGNLGAAAACATFLTRSADDIAAMLDTRAAIDAASPGERAKAHADRVCCAAGERAAIDAAKEKP